MKVIDKDSLIKFEETLAREFEEGKINCPLHLSGGNEDELISIFEEVSEKDYVFATHRGHYQYLLKGGNPQKLRDEIFGLETGMCGGKGRSMHLFDTSINFYSSAIVGGNVAPALGVAVAIKQLEGTSKDIDRTHVWCFLGDGAEDSGWFVECARLALARDLPITYIVEDNDLSIDVTKAKRWHSYHPIESPNVIRYTYTRKYPHVGIGKHISF